MSRKIVFFLLMLIFSASIFGQGKEKPVIKSSENPIVSERESRKFQYYFLEALRQKMLGNRDAAADNLMRCFFIDPENAVVFSELANLNITIGRTGFAKRYMNQAVMLDPENYWSKQALAQLYIQNMEYSKAADLFEDILKYNPQKKELNYTLATLYTQMQEPEKAIKSWNALEEDMGMNDQVSIEKFKLYWSQGNKKKAFDEIHKLIKAFPKEMRYKVLEGDLYQAVDEPEEAEKIYKQILKKYPNEPLASNQLGLLYLFQGKKEEGIKLLISVMESKDADFDQKKTVMIYLSQDPESLSLVNDSIYLNFIRAYPNEEFPYLTFATSLLDREKDEGIGYLRQALDINPQYEEAWSMLIDYYAKKEDTTGVVKTTREAIEYFPDNPKFYYILGANARIENNNDAAIEVWQKSLSLAKEQKNPALVSMLLGSIGDLYINMGEKEKGYAAYDEALTYSPGNMMILNNYAYFLSLEGKDLDKAEKMSGRTVRSNPKSMIFLDTYAWIYFKQGDYMTALLYIEQAYNNGGNSDKDVLEHYGDILYKTGNKEKAREMWKSAWQMIETDKEKEGNSILKKKMETGEYAE